MYGKCCACNKMLECLVTIPSQEIFTVSLSWNF
jgi:hypothetical protein